MYIENVPKKAKYKYVANLMTDHAKSFDFKFFLSERDMKDASCLKDLKELEKEDIYVKFYVEEDEDVLNFDNNDGTTEESLYAMIVSLGETSCKTTNVYCCGYWGAIPQNIREAVREIKNNKENYLADPQKRDQKYIDQLMMPYMDKIISHQNRGGRNIKK